MSERALMYAGLGLLAGLAYLWYENRFVAAANASGNQAWQQLVLQNPEPDLSGIKVNPNMVPQPSFSL